MGKELRVMTILVASLLFGYIAAGAASPDGWEFWALTVLYVVNGVAMRLQGRREGW